MNLGNPDEYEILDLAEKVLEMTQSPSRVVFTPLPEDDPRRRRPDIFRAAERLLGWRALGAPETGSPRHDRGFPDATRSAVAPPGDTTARRPALRDSDLQSKGPARWERHGGNACAGRSLFARPPWFHNLNIRGVDTAPDHFLGDYPRQKWEGFRHVGHCCRTISTGEAFSTSGCNAGFFALEMKTTPARDASSGSDTDPLYLRQAAFAIDEAGADIELRQMSVYEIGALGERFDLVLFMGVFLSPASPASGARHDP